MIYNKDIDLSIFQPYKINCESCSGLCCVALYFSKSDGFPKDKKAGTACKNLQTDYKCKIYPQLPKHGLKGCMAYDCFGAGQYITRYVKDLPNWLTIPQKEAEQIFNSFLVVMRVYQTLWYLSQCLILQLPQSEKEKARSLIDEGNMLIDISLEKLAVLDTQPFCEKANNYLKHICTIFQSYFPNSNKVSSKDYIGKNMKQKDLRGKDFSMSLLIAANLERSNLYGANFLGADTRDTNICNTDLSQCLFLTQIQINSANGNDKTLLPPYLHKPKTWGLT
ncbi:MAG: pentapeptide repeat-containing protein [Eubacteriales bacterium]|nr:pentapeptide repeat-containing protein [Eubacteriales bacterium]